MREHIETGRHLRAERREAAATDNQRYQDTQGPIIPYTYQHTHTHTVPAAK